MILLFYCYLFISDYEYNVVRTGRKKSCKNKTQVVLNICTVIYLPLWNSNHELRTWCASLSGTYSIKASRFNFILFPWYKQQNVLIKKNLIFHFKDTFLLCSTLFGLFSVLNLRASSFGYHCEISIPFTFTLSLIVFPIA